MSGDQDITNAANAAFSGRSDFETKLAAVTELMRRTTIGRIADDVIVRHGVRESSATLPGMAAIYRAFEKCRFVNQIQYGADEFAGKTIARIAASRVHEATHVGSYIHAACLYLRHSSFGNFVYFCPRDIAIMNELLEMAAVMKELQFQCELGALEGDDDRFGINSFRADIRARGKEPTRIDNIIFYYLTALRVMQNPVAELEGRTCMDYYHERALSANNEMLASGDEVRLRFVRLTHEDAIAIGDGLGLNMYRMCPVILEEMMQGQHLSDSTKQRITAMNAQIGIQNEDALPTMADVLSEHGVTPRELMLVGQGQASWTLDKTCDIFFASCG